MTWSLADAVADVRAQAADASGDAGTDAHFGANLRLHRAEGGDGGRKRALGDGDEFAGADCSSAAPARIHTNSAATRAPATSVKATMRNRTRQG